MFNVAGQYSLKSLKMVALLLFYLVGVFIGRTSSGVVPQNFKSIDGENESSHLEDIFTNEGANVSNLTFENSDLHNESSSVLVDFEHFNASHVSIPDPHNISDSGHVKNTIPEESHVVKKISTGSSRSKKKVSKESKKKRESSNKTFTEESDHAETHNLKSTTSVGDHSDDFHHIDNSVSKRFDHTEPITNNHSDIRSDQSEDLTIESDHLNSVSKSVDHDVNIENKEFNTSVSDDINHMEEVKSDLNDLNRDHLNDSVVDLKVPLNEVTENVSEELNSTVNTASELNNHTQTNSDAPKTVERDHSDHMEDSHNTTIQSNQAATSLSNSTKLFLNIHNSFMKLNRTDKTDSALLNHIDKTSSESSTNIHDRLNTTKIDEESSEKSSAIEISSEGFSSSEIQTDIPSNITKEIDSINVPVSETKDNGFEHKTNADILVIVSPNDSNVHFPSDHPDEFHVNLNVNLNKSEFNNSDINKPIVAATNETQGLFSSLGLDFLMNSELAKNAASAMEVFNFSDSALTDHIVDDTNDMHDFLDLIPLEHSDNQSISDRTPITSSTLDAESSTLDAESSTLDAESSTLHAEISSLDAENSSPDSESSSLDAESSSLDAESSPLDAESSPLDVESSSLDVESTKLDAESSSKNGSFEVFTSTPSHPILNSTVEFEVTTLPSQIIFNSTVEYEVITMPSQLLLNSSVEYEATTPISPPTLRNDTESTSEVKCPPPGFCIFWFLGQDTCTVNSHCLGSRICCQIGCTKTCIEV